MWGVCRFEELGVKQHARALTHTRARAHTHARTHTCTITHNTNRTHARAHTHTHTQKEPDDQLDAECHSASSISVRHEPEKLCHSRPGDEPFKMDGGNKCLSKKVQKNCLMGYGVDGRRIRLRLPSWSYFVFFHLIQACSVANRVPTDFYPMSTRGRVCGR